MSLFEEYEKRIALNPRPLFTPQTPTQPINQQERLAQLKAQYEVMRYEQKIRKMQNPSFYRVRVTKTYGGKKSGGLTRADYQKAAEKLKTFGKGVSSVARQSYGYAKPRLAQAKANYQRAGGVKGVGTKLRTFFTGSIYK